MYLVTPSYNKKKKKQNKPQNFNINSQGEV